MSKDYDFVVFGASGFTGKYVCKELLKKSHGLDAKIAFAGRSREKLEGIRRWIQNDHSQADDIGLIIADVEDDQSLLNMCKQSKIVLDCVGPFRLWGEPVVKACIEAGSDYVDITGEPEYIERIKREYHGAATEKGVYIVSACGFDSIPSELGIIYAKEQFGGTLATVENYFTLLAGEKGLAGNYGTYSSLVNGMAGANSLRAARKSVSRKPLPLCGPKLKNRGIHYSSLEGAYSLPFFGADVSIVRRSERYYTESLQEVPAQFSMYFCTSFFQMLLLLLFGVVLKVLTSFSWGTALLLRYPSFFSGGAFTKQGPSEQQMAEGAFQFKMHCRGYKKRISLDELIAEGVIKDPLDSEMVVTISGPEIGYVLTPILMVQSAILMKEERDKLPSAGGVFTPGPAFKKTSLIQRMQQNGVSFEITR